MQPFHTEEYEGFMINVYALPEDTDPRDSFAMGQQEDSEICDQIARGVYEWFCAKVTASKCGIELSADYLGCCCYENFADFIQETDYYGDMRQTVVNEARARIQELSA